MKRITLIGLFFLAFLQPIMICADATCNLDFIRRYSGGQGKIMQTPVYFRKNRKSKRSCRKQSRKKIVQHVNTHDLECVQNNKETPERPSLPSEQLNLALKF